MCIETNQVLALYNGIQISTSKNINNSKLDIFFSYKTNLQSEEISLFLTPFHLCDSRGKPIGLKTHSIPAKL